MRRRCRAVPVLAVLLSGGTVGAATATGAASPEPLLTVRSPEIAEASGIAVGVGPDGLVYLVEDAGRPAVLHGLDADGRTSVRLEVPVANEDWEDVASTTDGDGRPALLLGDIGDAGATRQRAGAPPRSSFSLVRVDEPRAAADPDVPTAATGVEVYPVRYEDGRPRNAESLAVDPVTGTAYVVDKVGDGGRRTRLWAAPADLDPWGTNVLTEVARLPLTGASGAAFSRSGDLFVVRDGTRALVWTVTDGDLVAAVAAEPSVVPLPPQRQGEGVAVSEDGRSLLLSTEGRYQTVAVAPLPDAVAPVGAAAGDEEVDGARSPDAPPAGDGWVLPTATGLTVVALVAVLGTARVRRRRGDHHLR